VVPLNTKSWVSGAGSDAAACTRAAPCLTFNHAISQTNAGGSINCLDQGGFGTLTIDKAITIDCTGTLAGILVTSGSGIFVNAGANDVVRLRGLSIEGVGPHSERRCWEPDRRAPNKYGANQD
jgi:hypothetical protein